MPLKALNLTPCENDSPPNRFCRSLLLDSIASNHTIMTDSATKSKHPQACAYATRACESVLQLSRGSDETPGRHLTYQRAKLSHPMKVSALIALKTCFW